MKVFLFLLLPSYFIFSYEKLDKCNGIANFVFGTPKEQFKDMTLEMEQGNSQLYSVNSNALKIQGVQLEYLRASFIKNKLSALSLSTKNATGAVFFKYLKDNYGSPKKNKNLFEWHGEHITIVFELYSDKKDAAIDFYS